MLTFRRSGLAVGFALFVLAVIGSDCAHAQFARTFVSGKGVDSGACSLAAPCRSFAYALTQTAANGELAVLDTAGYGPMTIAQSVSILAPPGISARISVTSGAAITVNGAGINVILTGIGIDGTGSLTVGVLFQNGASLSLDRIDVNTPGNGVQHNAGGGMLKMANSVLRGAARAGSGPGSVRSCFVAQGASPTSFAFAAIEHSRAEGCYLGFTANSNASISVAHSSAAGDSVSNLICFADFNVQGDPTGAGLMALDDVVASNCGNGVLVGPFTGIGHPTIWLGNSLLYGTAAAVSFDSESSTIRSFGNNQFANNASDGTAPIATTLK